VCLRHDASLSSLSPWQLLLPCPAALAGSLPALLLLTRIVATTAFLLLILPLEVRYRYLKLKLMLKLKLKLTFYLT
jgi:hypothetical protein